MFCLPSRWQHRRIADLEVLEVPCRVLKAYRNMLTDDVVDTIVEYLSRGLFSTCFYGNAPLTGRSELLHIQLRISFAKSCCRVRSAEKLLDLCLWCCFALPIGFPSVQTFSFWGIHSPTTASSLVFTSATTGSPPMAHFEWSGLRVNSFLYYYFGSDRCVFLKKFHECCHGGHNIQ